jgi:hypothetical protein
MAKYHSYPRRELRVLFRHWAWHHRLKLGVVTLGAVVLIAFETWMFSISGGSATFRWYLMGCLHVAIVAAYFGTIVVTFLVHERGAILQLRGAWGEDFTQDELKRARRRKLIWGWVDSVTLQTGDIDHLVVTKSGGLVAIDSKWRSGAEHLDRAAVAREATRARLRAEGFVNSFLRAERSSRRASGKAFRVRPLVVVWGVGDDALPVNAAVDGVDIIEGHGLVNWLARLDGDTIDEAAAAEVLAEIERRRASAWSAATAR